MTNVEQAKKTLNDLEDARAWRDKIAETIKEVSYAAHTGDAGARNRLDELNDQQRVAEQDAKSLEIAIAEAKCRLQAAQAAEQDERERDQAKMSLGLVTGFIARGRALDEKLTAFVEEYQALSADFHDLQKTGYPPSSWQLVEVNLKNSLAFRLMGTPMQTDFLPPNQRHTFEEVINAWGTSVRMRAEGRLAKGTTDKAA